MTRLRLLRFFAITLLPGPPTLAHGGDGRGFVRVEGTQLMEGQQPFYFVGANLHVMHGPVARPDAAETIAQAAADGLRVGRIWALGEGPVDAPAWKARDFLFRAGPTGWREEAYAHLDWVIASASKHDLRLIVVLSNRWKDYGGIPMYLRWAGYRDVEAYGYSDRFFADKRVRAWYWEHVRRIVTRVNSITGVPYRNDPTIMTWELQNELGGTPEAAPQRRAWFTEMAARIRQLDPNHLVVPGLIGYSLQIERDNWITMCQLPAVSYCDQHIYPRSDLRSRSLGGMRRYIDDRVQLAHYVVRKPLIFGEFGFSAHDLSRAARARWHRQFLQRLFYDGASGGLVWIYQPTMPWKRAFGILTDKPRDERLRRALAAVARRVSSGGVKPRNPIITAARGREPIAPTHVLMREYRGIHGRWLRRQGVFTLALPVDHFYRAWFENAGSWDGGTLVHAYGRRTGWMEYRFAGPAFVPQRLQIRARLSSEFPGSSAPKDGYSEVVVYVDNHRLAQHRVSPDNGRGSWIAITITDSEVLRSLRRGVHRLRFAVEPGPLANGVAIYGREAPINREPVVDPGPLQLRAYPAGPG